MVKYDFDTVVNRNGSNSLKWDTKKYAEKSGFADRFDDDTIPVYSADMDFCCAKPIIEAAKKVADFGIFGYSAVEASDAYYDAVINWNQRKYHRIIQKDWIFYTRGTIEAIGNILSACTSEGDGVIIMQPVYHPFSEVIERKKRVVVNCQLQHDEKGYYTVDYAKLEELSSKPENKALLICNPHNPVGRVWKPEELRKIHEITKKYGMYLISDEVHGDILRKGITFCPVANAVEDQSNIITVTSVSKTFNLAGMHISNVIISDENIQKKYRDVIGFYRCEPSPFEIEMLIAAYNESEEWLDQVNDYIDGNIEWALAFLKENMPKVICRKPEGSYLLWLDFGKCGYSPKEIRKRIRYDANVFTSLGEGFGTEPGECYHRICLPMSRKVVEEVFCRIKNALEK